MLTIYKASAGSGKTFQLVVEYLKLLLKNPYNYKHILAVTFTNKATNEMKTRILEQLYLLASNRKSNYIKELCTEAISEKIIRANAKIVLKNILHDYNRFSISTIDSFTQRIIKSFNRELGISPNFTLELDSEMILAEAIDRMMAKIDKDKKLLKWLKAFSKEKIESTKSQRIDDNIKALGKELFKENFQLFFPDDSESVYSRENLDRFTKELNGIISKFKETLKSFGEKGTGIIASKNLSIDDFSGKSRGVGAVFSKYATGNLPNISKTILNAAATVEKWYTKTNVKKDEIHSVVETELQPLLQKILNFVERNEAEYYTAVMVNRQIRMLGILTDLKEEIKILLHEKGILQISDSNLLLSKIIGQSDSPFIYEKTGNYFNHFMLDEFQDTSTLQWRNFKPLIQNSLAEGNENLIVGDVKQSIYRWRNSDWKILAEQIYSDFRGGQMSETSLDYNWRSDKNIVLFNNAIFESLKATFESTLLSDFDDEAEIYSEKFDNIYNLFAQKLGIENSPETGFVDVRFLPSENFQEESTSTLIEQVKMLQDKGIKALEIAILIRKNSEGVPIIEEFLKAAGQSENKRYNLSVLSNESLFLYASRGVLFVMETIEFLIDPENKITKVSLLNLWMDWLKPELQNENTSVIVKNTHSLNEKFEALFETELAPQLKQIKEKILLTSLDETITQISAQFNLFKLKSELPFLQTLIDKAGELKTSLSNDLSNLLFWWNEKGYRTSVNVNEEIDSIRLLTVHRSKGLEFKAVLLPYLDWKTSWSGTLAPTLWCKPEKEPFNKFPLLPVVAGNDMKKSYFKAEYFTEKANVIIDTFNLIYVAFTRAKSALFINCPAPKENSRIPGKSANHLLKESLEKLSTQNQFLKCWNAGGDVFQFGTLPLAAKQKTASKSVLITNYQFNNFTEKIKLRATGEEFLIEGEKNSSIKNRGKIIHEILAEIETGEEIDAACLKAFNNGIINETELAEIGVTLKESLKNPQIAHWFDDSYKVINERSLLTADRILRPDRIMISGNRAIVVDYKTGAKKSENYNRQVARYAKTLKETGMEKVTGFLWYINQNEVEKVCE
jgi:ATP-dependent exoDNAse (exonuclease V) beta subunit